MIDDLSSFAPVIPVSLRNLPDFLLKREKKEREREKKESQFQISGLSLWKGVFFLFFVFLFNQTSSASEVVVAMDVTCSQR